MWPSITQVIILLTLIILVVIPPVLVLFSPRSQGGEKFGWFVAALLFSWLGYIGFVIASKQPKHQQEN